MKTLNFASTTAISVGLLSSFAIAFAQTKTPDNQVLIYGGQTLDSIGAHATSWGGGTAEDHDGDAFTTAGHAIHIETAGLYQGGTITFDTPVDLGSLKADPTRFIQIIFSADKSSKYVQPVQQTLPTGLPYGAPRTPFGGSPFGFPGAGPGFGAGSPHFKYGEPFQIAQFGQSGAPPPGVLLGPYGGGNPAAGGYRPGMTPPGFRPGTVPATQLPPDDTTYLPPLAVNQIHVILIFADGSESEMLRPLTLAAGDDTTWLRAGIPLTVIPTSATGDAQLKAIRLGSDVPADLNIGEIRLVNDTTALTADAGKSETVPAESEVTLVGTGEGGASALKYEWDFDSSTPFVPQAEGIKVTHVFDKAGDYTVTLKVSDVDGIKQPATATVVIHVNDQSALPASGPPPGFGGPPPGFGGLPPGFAPNQ